MIYRPPFAGPQTRPQPQPFPAPSFGSGLMGIGGGPSMATPRDRIADAMTQRQSPWMPSVGQPTAQPMPKAQPMAHAQAPAMPQAQPMTNTPAQAPVKKPMGRDPNYSMRFAI